MARISYDGKVFRSVSNSRNGEVSSATEFHYKQTGNVVAGTYGGGEIVFGTLLALCDDQGELDMRYQHVNQAGELMTGTCRSTPELLPDCRIRLHESWQWTCKDMGRGESVLEEIKR